MRHFIIYEEASGEIRGVQSTNGEFNDAALEAGQAVIEVESVDREHNVVLDGVPRRVDPQPTLEERIKVVEDAVQRLIDSVATAMGYDSMLSLASYAASSNPLWAEQAAAGIAYRDTCWTLCYQGLQDVLSGTRTMPTPAEAVAELPTFEWPEGWRRE